MAIDKDALLLKISKYKNGAFAFQQRRHFDWKENYELYRDKVTVNRLTQRQSVNLPIMKETLQTMLAKTDDAPDIVFEEIGGDQQKEIYLNEYWKWSFNKDVLEIKDIVDKKQVYFYGRSFKKLNIRDGRIVTTIEDPQDILVERFTDPTDLDSSHYIGHIHIYRTLKYLEENKNYDQDAVEKLKIFYGTNAGLIQSAENQQALQEKNAKLREMGDTTVDNPEIGEIYVEINENYIKLWDDDEKNYVWHVVTTCDQELLSDKKVKEVLNVDFQPFTTWASDVERTDFWSDGIGDIVRTPNKVINAWFSQLIENRTLRNFGMNYYDSSMEGFVPQTFVPSPWGWYPVPGDPNKTVKRVDIPDLSDSLDEISFVIGSIERSTGATANEKGVKQPGQVTLGEIKLMAVQAQERITGMAKFYKRAWKEYGQKWVMLVMANTSRLGTQDLTKKSYNGKLYKKTVKPADFYSKEGYVCRVTSSAEQEQEQLGSIQKLAAVAQQFQDNSAFQKIYKEKMLDIAKLTPEEKRQVIEFEEQKEKDRKDRAKRQLLLMLAAGGRGQQEQGGQPPAGGPGAPEGSMPVPPQPSGAPV